MSSILTLHPMSIYSLIYHETIESLSKLLHILAIFHIATTLIAQFATI